MTYATKQDMIDRFEDVELIQLTDRSGDALAIDDVVLGRALDDADSEIDAYLMGRYKLPLQTTPKILVLAACDIARYKLYDNRVTEQVEKRYNDAVKLLTNIGMGKISIGPNSDAVPAPATSGPQVAADERVFSRDTLRDY